jgi:large subunit ribosomal protein L29
MKTSEIREFTVKELEERIENEQTFLSKMKLNHAISPLDNPMKIRDARHNIARMKTELRNRQLTENNDQ